mmetsp:Transcript_28356/g.51189  ORF Transcript_28356/g.51189 Transcript_28356/m.51189 type:complete len:579 (+) Transcript_28356:36-1772(+)
MQLTLPRRNASPFQRVQFSEQHLGRRAPHMNWRWLHTGACGGCHPSAGSKTARTSWAESELFSTLTGSGGIAATLVCGLMLRATARKQATRSQSLVALQVLKRTGSSSGRKYDSKKAVTATTRLPLWQLTDEMYLERQIAPDPSLPWSQVNAGQVRMKHQVKEQQQRDFFVLEKEAAGTRLPPTYAISELRPGMWLEGRVSRRAGKGVMVDVGAYTERGEWLDGRLHMSQLQEDGDYVGEEDIMNYIHLGEYVRVRVEDVSPAMGRFQLSMRANEDLPQLFLGKPRQYSMYDLEVGMKVPAVVRRVWELDAWVDIGADKLAKLSVRDHYRTKNAHGFLNTMLSHHSAKTAYPKGAQFDVWIKEIDINKQRLVVSCNEQRGKKMRNRVSRAQMRSPSIHGVPTEQLPEREERLGGLQKTDRERSAKETENWKPYVAHVDEWLQDASIADDATDSWIARAERQIFADSAREDQESSDPSFLLDTVEDKIDEIGEAEFEEDEFGEDEFADDDFADNSLAADETSTASDASAQELDGWEMEDDNSPKEGPGTETPADSKTSLSEAEVEDLFFSAKTKGTFDL